MKDKSKFRFGMFLVTIGIVYGDIGTSPMYVMKSILEGNGGITQINEAFIIGSLSLVIWTITLLTTVKYVLIAMKADNHGEGGIFSLFSLVRGCGKWLIVPAMLGGAALLADGVLTPAVTVTTAVEGLRSMEVMDRFLGTGQVKVVVITSRSSTPAPAASARPSARSCCSGSPSSASRGPRISLPCPWC